MSFFSFIADNALLPQLQTLSSSLQLKSQAQKLAIEELKLEAKQMRGILATLILNEI
jgi:hypothetical protein